MVFSLIMVLEMCEVGASVDRAVLSDHGGKFEASKRGVCWCCVFFHHGLTL